MRQAIPNLGRTQGDKRVVWSLRVAEWKGRQTGPQNEYFKRKI